MAKLYTIQAAGSSCPAKPERNSSASPESIQFGALSPRIAILLRSTVSVLISSTRGAAISLIVAMLLLAPMASHATTYYVAPTGSDSATGTASFPFQSIQKAGSIVNPGDTVIVKDGIYISANAYLVTLSRGGTAALPITFKAENQYGAILDGQNYTKELGVVFWASYINFDGFQIRNFRSAGLWLQGSATGAQTHDLTFTRNWVHHIGRIQFPDCNGTTNPAGAFSNGWVHHVTWDSNMFNDIGRVPTLACDANLGSTPNYRHDHGLYLQGKYHTVTNNIFYNMYAGYAIKCDGHFGALTNLSDRSHTIINNTFAHASVPRETTGHIRFFSNDQGGGSAEVQNGVTMQRATNVLIENNISYNPPYWGGAGATSWGPTFVAALYDGVMYHTGTVVRNNITTASSIIDEVSGGSEITSKVTFSGNRVQTDPLLMDPANNQFKLPAASVSRLGGYAPGNPPHDFAGVSRPSASPDVGAYQYVADSTTPLVVASPTNGATVTGTIGVQVVNSVSVSSVALSIDGATVAQMAPPFSFALDTSTVTNGAHILLATARDSVGTAYTAAPITINVSNPPAVLPVDTTPPIVTISNPSNGSLIKGPVAILVSATDNSGAVTLSLYIDARQVSSTNLGKIAYQWNGRRAQSGTHTIRAIGRDAAGNTASTSISVITK